MDAITRSSSLPLPLLPLLLLFLASLIQSCTSTYTCSTHDDYSSCQSEGGSCINKYQQTHPNCPPTVLEGSEDSSPYPYPFGHSECGSLPDGNPPANAPDYLLVTVIPYNNEYFIVNVAWSIAEHAMAYKVEFSAQLHDTIEDEIRGEFCFYHQNTTSKNFSFGYSYGKTYSNCGYLQDFKVTVRAYPTSNQLFLGNSKKSHWPTNCYDFTGYNISQLNEICGPPLPDVPQNVTTQTTPLTNSSVSLQLNWTHPDHTPPLFPIMEYYFEIYDLTLFNRIFTYGIYNTTSINMEPLLINHSYHLTLMAYQPHVCTDKPFCDSSYFPCGRHWTTIIPSSITTANITATTTAATTTTTATTGTTTLLSSVSMSTTPSPTSTDVELMPHHELIQITVPSAVGGAIVLILTAASVMILIIIILHVRRPHTHPEISFPPSLSPSPTLSTVVSPPFSPPFTPPPYSPTLSPSDPIAVIIYSRASPDIEIQAIIHYLRDSLIRKGIQVHYLDRYSPHIPAEWLSSAPPCSKMLCVCNEQFHNEWTGKTPNSLVSTCRLMLYSHVQSGQSPSDKFLVIHMNKDDSDDYKYVPDQHYLRCVQTFHITDTEGIASCLSNVDEFDASSVYSHPQ